MKKLHDYSCFDGKVIETNFRDWLRQRKFALLFSGFISHNITNAIKYPHNIFNSDNSLWRIWLMGTHLSTCQNKPESSWLFVFHIKASCFRYNSLDSQV